MDLAHFAKHETTERLLSGASMTSPESPKNPVPGHDTVRITSSGPLGSDTAAPLPSDITSAEFRNDSVPLASGTPIDRYVVIECLGQGGMGRVYKAFDPELNRAVAVKVILVTARETTRQIEAQVRLQREAQALAKVSHRNVVGVYDVGTTSSGDVFVAMEYIDGSTLGDFCQGKSWRSVVDVYIGAAAGLGACHRQGLVHRDFKPSNVLVDSMGRPVVLDFGLAQAANASSDRLPTPATGERSQDLLETPITAQGVRSGTLAYMSPEQYSRESLNAASDQFSFCVALFESLYGERPFEGNNAEEVGRNLLAGKICAPKRGAVVPNWVHTVLMRGLQVKPEDRFHSMNDLLAALANDPRRRRRWQFLLGAAVVLAAVAIAGQAYYRTALVRGCDAEGRMIEASWNSTRAQSVAAAFSASSLEYASENWRRAEPYVDTFVQEWADARTSMCTQALIHKSVPEALLHSARDCFEEQKTVLDALLARWDKPDNADVQQAVWAASSLPKLRLCTDAEELSRRTAASDNPQQRAAEQKIRLDLAQVSVLFTSQRYPEALTLARTAFDSAQAKAREPLQAASRVIYGVALQKMSRIDEAEEMLRESFASASVIGDDITAFEAASQMVWLTGYLNSSEKEATQWYWLADIKRRRLMLTDNDFRVAALNTRFAVVLFEHDKLESALEHLERGRRGLEHEVGQKHPEMGTVLTNIGLVHQAMGNRQDAIRYYTESLALRKATSGVDNPRDAHTFANLAVVHSDLGHYDQSLEMFARAFELFKVQRGPNHPMLGQMLGDIAGIYSRKGEHQLALETVKRALAILEANAERPQAMAYTLSIKGEVLMNLGEYDEALRYLSRALSMDRETFGQQHRYVAGYLTSIGDVFARQARWTKAREHYEEALRIYGKSSGEEGSTRTLHGLGVVLGHLEQKEAAEKVLREAVRARRQDGTSEDVADSLFALADVLWADVTQRNEALSHAREALKLYEKAPQKAVMTRVRNVRAWLDERQ